MDKHLAQQPDVLLFDQDDDAILIGIKVSKQWLQNQSRTFHDALLAMLAQMTDDLQAAPRAPGHRGGGSDALNNYVKSISERDQPFTEARRWQEAQKTD